MMDTREDRIVSELEKHGIDAFLFAGGGPGPAGMIRFLSGFRGFGGVVCWSRRGGRLFVHPMDEAKAATESFCAVTGAADPLRAAVETLTDASTIGIDPASLSVAGYRTLTAHVAEDRLRDAGGFLGGLTLRKEPWQQELLREAGRVVTGAVESAFSLVREGISESEAAAEVAVQIYRHGGDGVAFVLVAFGENSAYPHHLPTRTRRLVPGDLVLIDCGAILDGYASDITRTAVWGEPTPAQSRIYDVVWRAQEAALCATCVGAVAEQVDAAARRVIDEAGLGDRFPHSLGHGLGLSLHPRLRIGERTRLEAGMTFTVEPGVYLPGTGGVRIEDDVLLTSCGWELLTGRGSDRLVALPA